MSARGRSRRRGFVVPVVTTVAPAPQPTAEPLQLAVEPRPSSAVNAGSPSTAPNLPPAAAACTVLTATTAGFAAPGQVGSLQPGNRRPEHEPPAPKGHVSASHLRPQPAPLEVPPRRESVGAPGWQVQRADRRRAHPPGSPPPARPWPAWKAPNLRLHHPGSARSAEASPRPRLRVRETVETSAPEAAPDQGTADLRPARR